MMKFDVEKAYQYYAGKETATGNVPLGWSQYLAVCQSLCEMLLNNAGGKDDKPG